MAYRVHSTEYVHGLCFVVFCCGLASVKFRDHFVNAPSQWEMTLHCNIVFHWIGAFTKWSLKLYRYPGVLLNWDWHDNNMIATVPVKQPKLISPWTKWPPFRRWHFQMHILEWKYIDFDWNFSEFYSQCSNEQYSNICSDNGLAPTRRQAIIWTNADPVYQCIYLALGRDELRDKDKQTT